MPLQAFATPVDNTTLTGGLPPTLKVAYTHGVSSTITVDGYYASLPSVSALAPLRFTVIQKAAVGSNGSITDKTKLTIFRAESLANSSGDAVLGTLTAEGGNTAADFAVGDYWQVLWTAEAVNDIHAHITALEAGAPYQPAFGVQNANKVYAGPTVAPDATPAFRTLVGSDLPVFGSSATGAVPQSGGGTTNFLRADGGWDAPPYPPQFSNTVTGLVPVPLPAAGSTKFLCEDATWQVPAGGGGGGLRIGDAVGSGSANRVLFEDGSAKLADSANFTYASGTLTVASGNISCPGTGTGQHFGYGSSAASTGVAVGYGATSGGDGSVLIGYAATGTGVNSVGIGSSVTANGNSSVIIGISASGGVNSVVTGGGSTGGDGAVVCGYSSTASGSNSMVFGSGCSATGPGSICLGTSLTNAHTDSICLGFGSVATADNQLIIGSLYHSVNEITFGTVTPHIYFTAYDASINLKNIGRISTGYTDSTEISYKGYIALDACDFNDNTGLAREGIRVTSDGSSPMVGFFGVAPVVKQTGAGAVSAGGTYGTTEMNMLNAVYTALKNLGLIT